MVDNLPSGGSTVTTTEGSLEPAVQTVTPLLQERKTLDEQAEETRRKEAEKEKAKAEADNKNKELRPVKKNLEASRWGRVSDSSHPSDEFIDISGNISLARAQEKPPRHGEKIDWERELYFRLRDPLETLKELKRKGSLEKGKLTDLQRVMLAKFDLYDSRYREIERRRAVTDKKKRAEPENQLDGSERIFQSGEEAMQVVAFVIETEIIAAHALGYELTNGGQIIKNSSLNNETFKQIEQAEVPGKIRQAAHEIGQALGISNPEQKNKIIAAIASLGTTGGAAGVGTLIGLAFGNPALGAAVGAGAGVVISGGEIIIGSWVLSFAEPTSEKSVSLNLKFNPVLPGSASEKITDNLLAKTHFLDQGRRAQDYINHAELTRHGIYSRQGLRVENLGLIDWANPKKITPKQKALIESMGYNLTTITAAQKIEVQRIATAGDLWMVDLNPDSLSYPAGLMLDFDRRLRERIQTILARERPDLPVHQISTDVSYRDFSKLTMPERHRIVMEAISLEGIDECREGADEVLTEIATEGKAKTEVLSQIDTDADRLESGDLPLHKSEITEQQMIEENNRLAHARDTVTVITDQNKTITEIDGQIKQQQDAVTAVADEWNAAKNEQGARGLSGLIAQYETAKNTAITETINKLNEIDITSSGVTIPPGALTETTINDLYHTIKRRIETLQGELDIIDPAEAAVKKSAILNKTPGADTDDYNKRIKNGKEIGEQKAKLNEALSRVNDCKMKIAEQEAKIVAAENIVRQKEGAKISAEQKLTGLQDRRQKAIDEIWKWVDPKKELTHPLYGQNLYSTLLTEANLNVTKIRKELEERDIPILGEEAKPEEGKKKKEGVIVSKEDKERSKGMKAIAAVGREFSTKVQGLRSMRRDELQREFADPTTSHDHVLRYVFGAKVLAIDKKPFYQRLLSKAGLVEAYFEYMGMDEARAKNFFSREPEFEAAYKQSRQNNAQIEILKKRLAGEYQLQVLGTPGLETTKKTLEGEIQQLQAQNVRLLTPIYDRKIVPFLGEHGMSTSAFMGVAIDRMIGNAVEFNPFADAVQSAETILPHSGPDGSMSILGPDINPRDGSWINRGGTRWSSPGGYQVDGQAVDVSVATSIASNGELGTDVQAEVKSTEGLLAVLPTSRAQIVVGSPVEQELSRLGLLPHLYDAVGARRITEDAFDNWISARLPTTRPDMNNTADVGTKQVNDFLNAYGFEASVVDRIYQTTAVGSALNTTEVRNLARNLIDRQIQSLVLRLQAVGIADTDTLANWLESGANYSLGRTETHRMFASLARTICENPKNVNQELLGTRIPHASFQDSAGKTICILNNVDGQIMFTYYDHKLNQQQIKPLSEILKLDQAARMGIDSRLTGAKLAEILIDLGKKAMEAIRTRTP